ncbi:uncharacterized protein LOC113210461 [Frankliniella occidentalis]|uniref:Uncharacterized protein LOC113210461 n=1 Tax=Frankliniella occidentalis TaxID=133901 RepID=A0A6J1STR7_FRAOC|nr:uncharacterized protein LOC113210461 [Frankliniella occidentalis]
MSRLHCFLLALAGAALGEVFDEPCYELGKQWVYEAKDTLLCDRSGRRININKFCKAHLSSASGRLIIDSSKEDGPTDAKKQAGHFPELCLPGQRTYAVQAPWLCTCVMHKGRHRWECVVPEGRTAGGLDGNVSPGRAKRSAEHEHSSAAPAAPAALAEAEPFNTSFVLPSTVGLGGRIGASRMALAAGAATLASTPASTPASASAEAHEEHSGHNGTVLGRQASPPYKPNIIIDFCDEFGYVHSITSTMRECACDKDVIANRLFSFKDNDPYHSSGLFAAYECLPGTYSVRCEICYPSTQTCQPAPCP